MKTKRIHITTLLLLLFLLVAIWMLAKQVQKTLPDMSTDYPVFSSPVYLGVSDSTYYNYAFHVAEPAPGPDWSLTPLSQDTALRPLEYGESIWPQVTWLLRMDHQPDSLAQARLGVLPPQPDSVLKDLAITMLDERLQHHTGGPESIRILVPVTRPAHSLLQGYYAVAAFSNPLPVVQVFSVVPRSDVLYVTVCTVDESDYPRFRDACRRVTSRLKPLLSSYWPATEQNS
jgi:hypothetical protein